MCLKGVVFFWKVFPRLLTSVAALVLPGTPAVLLVGNQMHFKNHLSPPFL